MLCAQCIFPMASGSGLKAQPGLYVMRNLLCPGAMVNVSGLKSRPWVICNAELIVRRSNGGRVRSEVPALGYM